MKIQTPGSNSTSAFIVSGSLSRLPQPAFYTFFSPIFTAFVSRCVSGIPKDEKYKPYILKYKALILK